jgi:hypothetical protein
VLDATAGTDVEFKSTGTAVSPVQAVAKTIMMTARLNCHFTPPRGGQTLEEGAKNAVLVSSVPTRPTVAASR